MIQLHCGVKQLKIGKTMSVLHVNYTNMEGFHRDSYIIAMFEMTCANGWVTFVSKRYQCVVYVLLYCNDTYCMAFNSNDLMYPSSRYLVDY